jgi:hypothetical protein
MDATLTLVVGAVVALQALQTIQIVILRRDVRRTLFPPPPPRQPNVPPWVGMRTCLCGHSPTDHYGDRGCELCPCRGYMPREV